ncbi:EamA family transporter [Coralliovum pocilloporae]|uniref:EamA family transporter n=1 Tax=Coralliovum pocilloporae TaxID=3066369 RepID=UPI0033076B6A
MTHTGFSETVSAENKAKQRWTISGLNAVPPSGLLIVAILCIQLGAALAVYLFAVFSPVQLVFLRLLLAGSVLCLFCRPSLRGHPPRLYGMLLFYGASIAVFNWCFYEAIARIPLGIAVSIEFMGPLGVALVTSKRLLDALWVGLAGFGLFLLTPEIGGDIDPAGIAYAFAAALGWASFILTSQYVGGRLKGGSGLALGLTIAALVLFPLSGFDALGLAFDNPLFLTGVGVVAILSTALPFFLEFEALKRMKALNYGVLISIEPVVAMIVGAILLGEWVGINGVFSILLVTTAALGMALTDKSSS